MKGTDTSERGLETIIVESLINDAGYSQHLSLDIAIFINGLPMATFELKNKLTKQTFGDAIQQYKRDRKPGRAFEAVGGKRRSELPTWSATQLPTQSIDPVIRLLDAL